MEGAVSAALETAGQVLAEPRTAPQIPPQWPRVWLVAARILLIPVAAVARLLAWFEEKFSPHRPDASTVRLNATPSLQKDARPPRHPTRR
jgi:hypothetical protein